MRFGAVPDFDNGEMSRVIMGLIQRDGLTSLRGFYDRHDREEKIVQGVIRFGVGLEFADSSY